MVPIGAFVICTVVVTLVVSFACSAASQDRIQEAYNNGRRDEAEARNYRRVIEIAQHEAEIDAARREAFDDGYKQAINNSREY